MNSLPDQFFNQIQQFELYGMKGNRHSQDVLTGSKNKVLKPSDIRRMSSPNS